MRWQIKEKLQEIYHCLHRKEYIGTDPILIPLEYKDPKDQEVAGLIAATLSLGKADLIIGAAKKLLEPLGSKPASTLLSGDWDRRVVSSMKYRFFHGDALVAFLEALGRLLENFGSVQELFLQSAKRHGSGKALQAGLVELFRQLYQGPIMPANMIPDPQRGSCNKRMHMYLRWMIRNDAIDLGVWRNFSPYQLMMPVDTHIFRWGRVLGMTSRKTPGWSSVLEITEGFRELDPEDPVKYDFALARVGILGLLKDWSLRDILDLNLTNVNKNPKE